MMALVQTNLFKVQKKKKARYDYNAQQRIFEAGDQVLVLLKSTSSSWYSRKALIRLLKLWEGQLSGRNVWLEDFSKAVSCKHAQEVACTREHWVPLHNVSEEEFEEVLPAWKGRESKPKVKEWLLSMQRQQLSGLLGRYNKVLQNLPWCMTLATNSIETGEAQPVRLPPYHLP